MAEYPRPVRLRAIELGGHLSRRLCDVVVLPSVRRRRELARTIGRALARHATLRRLELDPSLPASDFDRVHLDREILRAQADQARAVLRFTCSWVKSAPDVPAVWR